jgi:hypothetical protein
MSRPELKGLAKGSGVHFSKHATGRSGNGLLTLYQTDTKSNGDKARDCKYRARERLRLRQPKIANIKQKRTSGETPSPTQVAISSPPAAKKSPLAHRRNAIALNS